MIFFFIWAVLCFAADRVLSGVAMEKYGAKEVNPIVRFLTNKIGDWVGATFLFGTIYLGIIIWLTEAGNVWAMVLICASYTAVVAHNVVVLYREGRG